MAATDSNDARASFSNANADVEIAAPGVNVLSTVRGGGYATLSGTSMATPHVSAVAGVLRQVFPADSAARSAAAWMPRSTTSGRLAVTRASASVA